MRDAAANGQLALLLEVAGTPKPGNVDRHREYPDLRFEHFLAGAVGARPGLSEAAGDGPLGDAFEHAVGGMSEQTGGNTQFGALLLLAPLVKAAATDRLDPTGASAVVEATTVEDACGFFRAFDHVDVAVDDPPADLAALDVRRGSDAIEAVRDRDVTLSDVMDLSAEIDGVAAEWTCGFPRSFAAAERLLADDGPVSRRASRCFLRVLAAEPDTFVVTRNGREVATEVTRRARAVLDGEADAAALADELVDRGVNPGTSADITAAALFVALERTMEV
jgi:triphosphoribosyl-dephospho-CoA synthase